MPLDDAGVRAPGRLTQCRERPVWPPSVERFRHSAVAGSKKQSASTPTWRVRARLVSSVRRRARSAKMTGDGPSSAAAASSARAIRGPAGPDGNGAVTAVIEVLEKVVELAEAPLGVDFGAEPGSARPGITLERGDRGVLVLDHAGDGAERAVGDVPRHGAPELSRGEAPRLAGRPRRDRGLVGGAEQGVQMVAKALSWRTISAETWSWCRTSGTSTGQSVSVPVPLPARAAPPARRSPRRRARW